MWQAAALYRDGDFKRAASLFSGQDTAEAVFNRANAREEVGDIQGAIADLQRYVDLGGNNSEDNSDIAEVKANISELKAIHAKKAG